jgi:hypothetical protein
MGIDISGLSKVRRIRNGHSDELCNEDYHYYVGDEPSLLDGLKPGCYVNEGRSFYFYTSYENFDVWQNALSQVLFGVQAAEVQEDRISFEGQPLLDLIDFPFSNDVGVGPVSSARLHEELVRQSNKVKRGFQRLAEEATRRRRNAKRPLRRRGELAKASASIVNQLGGVLVGGDNDPRTAGWEWKWELYRNFRRVLRVAGDGGLLLVSI